MLAAVNPSSNGQAGGAFNATSGPPPNVSSTQLGAPGTNAFPGAQPGEIKDARNNRNSNEKVPYARLVPIGAQTDETGMVLMPLPASHGIQTQLVDHALKSEYQDLKSGELAWVRGNYTRSIKDKDDKIVRPPGIYDFGVGPDRFQRLASTNWIERFFYFTHGDDAFDLARMPLTDFRFGPDGELSAYDIIQFARDFHDSVVTHTADVPYMRALEAEAKSSLLPSNDAYKLTSKKADGTPKQLGFLQRDQSVADVTGSMYKCGINTTTTSPFLHGFMMDDSFVKVGIPPMTKGTTRVYTVADEPPDAFYEFGRNYGDNAAFTALFSVLRSRGFFSWSPDGLTLSKLASPADDQMASEALDVKSGQLFNVAVAGNSIATTWTGNPDMSPMPGDGVYMLLVADIVTTVEDGGAPDRTTQPVQYRDDAETEEVPFEFNNNYDAKTKIQDDVDEDGNARTAGAAHVQKVRAYKDAAKAGPIGSDVESTRNATTAAFLDTSSDEAAAEYAKIAALSQSVRNNTKKVTEAVMTNFRWRRATSSYLANHSSLNTRSKHCRCGLGLGLNAGGDVVTGQYIVGAWRIGTVLDNAASRAGAPSMGVRTAPSSYAISVNVAVQWLSGDALFRKYDGRQLGLVGRGEPSAAPRDAEQYAPEAFK